MTKERRAEKLNRAANRAIAPATRSGDLVPRQSSAADQAVVTGTLSLGSDTDAEPKSAVGDGRPGKGVSADAWALWQEVSQTIPERI